MYLWICGRNNEGFYTPYRDANRGIYKQQGNSVKGQARGEACYRMYPVHCTGIVNLFLCSFYFN